MAPALDPLVAATWVPIDEVRPWSKNPRRNDAASIRVAESLRQSGWCDPLVVAVGPWGEMLASGHARIKAALIIERDAPGTIIKGAPGPRMVPVRRQEFETEAAAKRYAVVANASGALAEWDADLLGEVVVATGLDLTEWAWSPEDVAALFEDSSPPGLGLTGGMELMSPDRRMVTLVVALSVTDFNEVEAVLSKHPGARRDAFMAAIRGR